MTHGCYQVRVNDDFPERRILCRRKIGTLAIEWWLRQTRYGLGRVGLSCWCRAGVKTAGGVGGGCTWIIPSALALARVDIRTSLRYGAYVVRLIHAWSLGIKRRAGGGCSRNLLS